MKRRWIGLAEVKPVGGNHSLDGAIGAYVNIVALAEDAPGFERLARTALEECEFELIEATDVDTLEERIATGQIADKLMELAECLSEDTPILFDDFHSFSDE